MAQALLSDGFKAHRGAAEDAEVFVFLGEITDRVIGSAIRVHETLGPGLLESTYELALEQEFLSREIQFERQKAVAFRYGRIVLDAGFRLDFLVERELVVEIKSVERILDVHRAQVLTYMKLSGCRVGLLINFNVPVLVRGIRRLVLDAPD